MKRRKYLATLGTLAAGSAGAIGTGAFTSVSASRSVSVQTAADSNAFLALEAGDSGLVTGTDDGTLEINLDGTAEGADGTGVNMNAVTTIGYADTSSINHYGEPWKNSYAFILRNQGTSTYETVSLEYEFQDASWITGEDLVYDRGPVTKSSFIKFPAYGLGRPRQWAGLKTPYYSGGDSDTNGVYKQGNVLNSAYTGKIKPGEALYFSILVDTTGETASIDDKLSGSLTIEASDPV